MVTVLERRVRVRDDGSGEGRNPDASFSDFSQEPAIVLLGDPGMGKTTLFKHYAGAQYATIRQFLNRPAVTTSEALFLDGLDEYKAVSSSGTALDDVVRALIQRDRPAFRLSCRAADWYGQADEGILRDASRSGRLVVLELRPLGAPEIRQIVASILPNAERFMEEAIEAGLEPLLGNPQSLELIAEAWNSSQPPKNKFEAFDLGTAKLLREANSLRSARGPDQVRPDDLRRAAGTVAALTLLANAVGVSRVDVADGDGYVNVSHVPYREAAHIDTVLKRRIFVSPDPDRFELAHRTLAEFLAAEELSRRVSTGLPLDRVVALLCGTDGRPISSLRGLFAWLMCHLGQRAEHYIGLDPYGVATYGDASALSPVAQSIVWESLRSLQDPWFLTNEDDRGSFRGLATPTTAGVLRLILAEERSSPHLKIAALEAISNSASDIGLASVARDIVLHESDNTWLRTSALKAFARSVADKASLEELDRTLASRSTDKWASELRVELLSLVKPATDVAPRIVSILAQAAARTRASERFGAFHSLIELPSVKDVEAILETGSYLLREKTGLRFELETLFGQWLIRRLDDEAALSAESLACWLRAVLSRLKHNEDDVIAPLRARFGRQDGLFAATFARLVPSPGKGDEKLIRFLSDRVWRMLPQPVWPVPPADFLLAQAIGEQSPHRSANFFRAFLHGFPRYSLEVTQAAFDFVASRSDVAELLGIWNVREIEDWRREQNEARQTRKHREAEERHQNVAALEPHLREIREGTARNALVWAARVFLNAFAGPNRKEEPRERLVNESNEELTKAFMEGMSRFASGDAVPTLDAIVDAWRSGSIPYLHLLLCLSVWLRHESKLPIPDAAAQACIAVVVTHGHRSEEAVPGYERGLKAWFQSQCDEQPSDVFAALRALWLAAVSTKHGYLPGFDPLTQDARRHRLVATIAGDVLRCDIDDNEQIVRTLASFLVAVDRHAAIAIAVSKVDRTTVSTKIRALWKTVLFLCDPAAQGQTLDSIEAEPTEILWEVIDLLRASHARELTRQLPARQLARLVRLFGRRFPNVPEPMSSSGDRNPWDGSQFVSHLIKLLVASAADSDGDACVAALDRDETLATYRELLRHHYAQSLSRRRDAAWRFPSAAEIATALCNEAPASAADLLAYVVDHLNALGHELRASQRERHRAYWNQNGRNLSEPKPEEDCTGLLADDLMRRVQVHGLLVEVERHMVAEKECDIAVLQSNGRLLPIEVKHHYHRELWTAWSTQLSKLYGREASAGGLGIYLVIWSGTVRSVPTPPDNISAPLSACDLKAALESLIPNSERHRLRVVVVDISPMAGDDPPAKRRKAMRNASSRPASSSRRSG
jgi:hypothetical protein